MYSLFKPLLFRFNPEKVHDFTISGLAFTSRHPGLLRILKSFCHLQNKKLETKLFGLTFPNPIGLAAGMDKNARAIPAWQAMGFGFVEIGSITALAQPGNPQPRLFRLPEDNAIVNRMGFNNHGAQAVANRLKHLREQKVITTPLGINLGKSKVTALESAPNDYLKSLSLLWEYGDYFVINISSPNTPGLRTLQDKDKLEALLSVVSDFRGQVSVTTPKLKTQNPKPILLKIAPDLSFEQIDEILELVQRFGLSGIIATNTTLSREGLKTKIDEAGGLSGKPLQAKSLEILTYIRSYTALPIISVGGIFTEKDVLERLDAGANLIQIYTSLVYEGPLLPKRLNKVLVERRLATSD
jgi:dihydroorotate dehydrogenase